MFKSFKYAIQGIKDALKSEPNLRFHFLAAIAAIILGFYFEFSLLKFAILIVTIFMVIALELINTLIEKTVDYISLERNEKARAIKDISAGVVLLGAVLSTVIGLLLFLG